MRSIAFEGLSDALDQMITNGEHDTLTNCLALAARQYEENAVGFAVLYAFGGLTERSWMTPRAAFQFAEQFQRQAADAWALLARVEGDEDEAEEAA